jgi:hypothetical protein
VRRFKRLKPSHKGAAPQTVVREGIPINRRGLKMNKNRHMCVELCNPSCVVGVL